MATVPASIPGERTRKARERIDIRLAPQQKDFIEKAAQIKGLTLTDFIVQLVIEKATQTIREHETWTLERPDAEVFARALMNPPKLGARLTRAAERFRERQQP